MVVNGLRLNKFLIFIRYKQEAVPSPPTAAMQNPLRGCLALLCCAVIVDPSLSFPPPLPAKSLSSQSVVFSRFAVGSGGNLGAPVHARHDLMC